jgi:hypothetical protein
MSRNLSIVAAAAAILTVLLMCWVVWRMEQVTSYVVTESPANGTGEHWKARDPGGAWEISIERRRGEQKEEIDARVRFMVDLATAEARERGSR